MNNYIILSIKTIKWILYSYAANNSLLSASKN